MARDDKKEVIMLNLDDIIPNKFQPREVFDDQSLKELAVSIKEHGVIQPIVVREVNGKYEIIAGERRYKASALAGKTTIPAIVNNLDDKESSKVALLENLQRKNLNPIEEAKTYQKILELDEMTQEELAKTMGKSQSAVANKLRLLQLNDDTKKALLSEEISERHARTLLRIEDPEQQTEMLKKVITEKINVRDLEKQIDALYPKKEKEEEIPGNPPVDLITPIQDTIGPIQEPTPTTEPIQENVLNNFINSAPLAPTTEFKDPSANSTKVKIIDDDNPNGEEQFLDYSKINDDEDEDDEDNSSHTFLTGTTPNVEDIKENAQDINTVIQPTGGSSLDSLLNLPTPTIKEEPKEENFLTPAEAIVKNEETSEEENSSSTEDYFQTPDLASIALPSEIDTGEKVEAPVEEETVTPDVAIDKIKQLVDELKEKGINITMDEMNFPQKYQVIIKINKNE